VGEEVKLTRRRFLQVSGAAGAALAVGAGGKSLRNSLAEAEANSVKDEKWVYSSCLGCVGWCPLKAKVVDGKVVAISGNENSAVTGGKLCPRGLLATQILYDPDRVKQPMKRTNPKKGRGEDPGWVPISWDEALDTVAVKMKELRDNHEPHKMVMFRGRYTKLCASVLYDTFKQVYGTPNAISHSSICAETTKQGLEMGAGQFKYSSYDMERTNYMIVMGASPLESHRPVSRLLRGFGEMRDKTSRAKVVVFDPRMSVTAAKADEWHPINPGTDGALVMGMIHMVLTEGLWEKKFAGDFVVEGDKFITGKTVAEEDFAENWTLGLIKWWNEVVKDFTPEMAAEISGISVDDIKRITRELVDNQPGYILRGRGSESHSFGSYTSYAIMSLNALVGVLDAEGGLMIDPSPKFREDPVAVVDEIAAKYGKMPRIDHRRTARHPKASVVTNNVADAILNKDPYDVKMIFAWHNNFVFSCPNTERWEQALAEVPFTVHATTVASEFTAFADIILPTPTYLEKWSYNTPSAGIGMAEAQLMQPVVEPLYDNKSTTDITYELAKRIGGTVKETFDQYDELFKELGYDLNDPFSKNLTRYRIEELQPWDVWLKAGVWNSGKTYKFKDYEKAFKTESGKWEFISSNLKEHLEKNKLTVEEVRKATGVEATGETFFMPHYQTQRFLGDEQEYPLVFISYKLALTQEGRSNITPWVQELFLVMYKQGWDSVAELNPETAAKLGLKDGDDVIVQSEFGKLKTKVKTFEGIHPGVVAMAYGQGHWSMGRFATGKGVNPNEIKGVDYDCFTGQSCFFNTRVKISKA
jgi:anaerobic selenocysteine-containing dehydrogenase